MWNSGRKSQRRQSGSLPASIFFSAAAIAQHQRVSHLDLGGMRNRMVVDPAVEGSNI
jgi:hypothetical protein